MKRNGIALLVVLAISVFCLLAVSTIVRADGVKKVYFIAVDGMRADYLSTKDEAGNSLTPNLDAFLARSVKFSKCFNILPAFTDTNHIAIISSASVARSGIWGAGGFYAGFDDKGQPMLKLYDSSDVQVTTLYNSVKQADPTAKTAVISGKHWVAEMFANNNPVVDVMIHGSKFPDYIQKPKGYYLGGEPVEGKSGGKRIYLRGEDEPAPSGLLGMIGMTASDSPSDDWVADAAITEITKNDPAFSYTLLADMDTAGHIYGSYNVPEDWSGLDNREAMRAQMKASDAAVGKLLNFLDQSGRLKDAMVVIVADHGMSSTREPYQLPAGQSFESMIMTLISQLQQGKIGSLSVDIRKLLAENKLIDRLAAKDDAQPDYDYIFSEASSAYLYGVKPDKVDQIVKIIKDWNEANKNHPIWLVLNRDDMKNGVNDKTGLPFSLYNAKNAVNVCPKSGPCGPADGSPGTRVPLPDVAVFMNEGYINAVYPDAITQGAFAVMKSANLSKLPFKMPALTFVPGSHGTWDEQNVPLIIYAPGLQAGTTVDTNVSVLDIVPTVIKLNPAWSLPSGAEGKSLF